ncbi:hypothetical protein [Mycobacterium syngnathidarum]|uniref:T6SS immunity protein Tdi1 C-terminal domain-containing protein n=1 Tax=Mycobacterium syngnathidarum TaxID=1908205 RepID=A0A1S1K3H6_9MYCO|nr:hypothetical protein [Mycobacterium syngnathidarum]OHU01573.1 hypothetical protein BKG61_08670 [Mycobacterium syngnathidarum]
MEFSFDPPERQGAKWRPGLVGGVFADRGMCGRSMNRGLLRFHDTASAPAAQATVDAMFRTRGLDADVFAFDWLARQFAVTSRLTVEGTPDHTQTLRTVVVLDPFDGSITPWVDVQSFEGALSVPFAQDFLLPGLFGEWMNAVSIDQLGFDSCAGASVPGFYGGKREIGNLTLDSVEVYLAFAQQLWEHGQKNGPGSPPPHLATAKGQ